MPDSSPAHQWLPLGRCLALGAAAVSRHPLASAGLTIGFLLIAIGGCVVPWLNFPFVLFALAPWLGGAPMAALALVDGRAPRWQWWIRGFRRYERFLGLYWLSYLTAAAASLPWLASLWLARQLTPAPWTETLPWWGLGTTVALWILILTPYLFAPLTTADTTNRTLDGALRHARRLTAGHPGQVAAHGLTLVAVGLSGLLLAGVGVLWTLPWAAASLAVQYRHREAAGRQR